MTTSVVNGMAELNRLIAPKLDRKVTVVVNFTFSLKDLVNYVGLVINEELYDDDLVDFIKERSFSGNIKSIIIEGE